MGTEWAHLGGEIYMPRRVNEIHEELLSSLGELQSYGARLHGDPPHLFVLTTVHIAQLQ